MKKIFDKEFRDAAKRVTDAGKKFLREAQASVTDLSNTIAESNTVAQLKATVKDTVDVAKAAVSDVTDEMRQAADEALKAAREKQVEARKKCFKNYRVKAKPVQSRARRKAEVQQEINRLLADSVAYYVKRSDTPDSFPFYRSTFDGDEYVDKQAPVIKTAKVTVVGVVTKKDDGFYLNIAASRRNIVDPFIKQEGVLTALERAVEPTATYFDGKENTIIVGPFTTDRLYDRFSLLAQDLISRYEYSKAVDR